jgi:hypothetical protein
VQSIEPNRQSTPADLAAEKAKVTGKVTGTTMTVASVAKAG